MADSRLSRVTEGLELEDKGQANENEERSVEQASGVNFVA